MTVAELIELLEDCDPEAEVRLATQPHYPLAYHLAGIAVIDPDEVVWLLEGDHTDRPYDVPEGLWEMCLS
jgi:hypothetical protein